MRATSLCILLGVSASLPACDLPAVSFDGSASSGGGGATTTSAGGATGGGAASAGGGGAGGTGATAGGGTGGTGGTGGATTTTGGGGTGGEPPTGPVLECNYPTPSNCMPGQVCCLDKTDPYEDKCASPGGCAPASDYGDAKCSSDDHCEMGMHCCIYFVPTQNPLLYDVQSIYCDTACSINDDELPACNGDGDCAAYDPYTSCKPVLGYPTYRFCQAP